MKDTIWLVVSRRGVERMNKRDRPAVARDEILVKLLVTMPDSAFREPTLECEVAVEDWRQGIDIADVRFETPVITQAEAAMIREHRLAEMRRILTEQGYEIYGPEEEAAPDE